LKRKLCLLLIHAEKSKCAVGLWFIALIGRLRPKKMLENARCWVP